ncbi:MAG: exodeoxyribonuclease VII large subunit [Mailhella sp.]|nr:exodeoxyribonuclease VII large subunit [Mailhella sp.]
MDKIYSVAEILRKVNQTLDFNFAYVWVRGEVTDFKRSSSGHLYFSLKDRDVLLPCVWFSGKQKGSSFDPLTGECWEDGPRPSVAETMGSGTEVLCGGNLAVYEKSGKFQLVVDQAEEYGSGLFYAEFEKLKKKLSALGLFDAARKKPLPPNPVRVAVITSPSGAVIGDFARVGGERGLSCKIRLYPASVQGAEAPRELISALRRADSDGFAEVIALIRGGGSIQDLWAFNDEELVRAIASCRTPVVTGIGHDPDRTLADFAADVFCATPSQAAERIWPERSVLLRDLNNAANALRRAGLSAETEFQRQWEISTRLLNARSPMECLRERVQTHDDMRSRLERAFALYAEAQFLGFGHVCQLFRRTFCGTEKWEAELASSEAQLRKTAYGMISAKHVDFDAYERRWADILKDSLRDAGIKLSEACQKNAASFHLLLERKKTVVEIAVANLKALDPEGPLSLGFALVEDKNGRIVSSAQALNAGDQIGLRYVDGVAWATVTSVDPARSQV